MSEISNQPYEKLNRDEVFLLRRLITLTFFVIFGFVFTVGRLAVTHFFEFAVVKPSTGVIAYAYNNNAQPDPNRVRVPEKYQKKTVNLWTHPALAETVAEMTVLEKQICLVDGNMDIWISSNPSDLTRNLLNPPEGINVFQMDCRDQEGHTLVAAVVMLSQSGDLVAVLPLSQERGRAESLNFKNPDTLLVAAKRGSLLWNWRDGTVEILPFNADTHSLWFSNTNDVYYGMLTADVPTAFQSNGLETFKFLSAARSDAHLNFLSFGEGAAYLSARSNSGLQKVNLQTNTVEWQIGGPLSTFPIRDINGAIHDPRSTGVWDGPWFDQHKFQHLSDEFYSLFDNHVNEFSQFVDGKYSRIVLLKLHAAEGFVEEVFSFDTGDQSLIYGTADLMPSGAILGSSYPDVVYPQLEDYSYHQNLWEVSPQGQVVWRLGIKGRNVRNPADISSPYSHRLKKDDEPPVGWVVYTIERFYATPLVSRPCKSGNSIYFYPYNTIRTVEDIPGVAYLLDQTSVQIAQTSFRFQKSWVQEMISIEVPASKQLNPLTLQVFNAWNQLGNYPIGTFHQLSAC